MAYVPLSIAAETPAHIEGAVRTVFDPFFEQLHVLLSVRRPDQGARGSMQMPAAMLLLAAADAAAQFFHPGEMGNGARFKAFLLKYYPWRADPPAGFTPDEAVAFLWKTLRCPLLHGLGARHQPMILVKIGNVFAVSEEAIEAIERQGRRPHSEASIGRNDERSILWIEGFYWGLRKAIEAACADAEAWPEVNRWIEAGKYAG